MNRPPERSFDRSDFSRSMLLLRSASSVLKSKGSSAADAAFAGVAVAVAALSEEEERAALLPFFWLARVLVKLRIEIALGWNGRVLWGEVGMRCGLAHRDLRCELDGCEGEGCERCVPACSTLLDGEYLAGDHGRGYEAWEAGCWAHGLRAVFLRMAGWRRRETALVIRCFGLNIGRVRALA